ncbi:PilW family protein [Patescibacteria group bacterium]
MKKKLTKGFTLLEMLLTLASMGLILVLTTSTFLQVMVRSAKIRVVKAVEDDGRYALRIMEHLIRNARQIRGPCQVDMDSLTIVNYDEGVTTLECVNEGLIVPELDSYIASVSAISQRLTSPKVKLDSCSFSCVSGGVEEPDQVRITYTLSQEDIASRVEEQASVDFESLVTLRNY